MGDVLTPVLLFSLGVVALLVVVARAQRRLEKGRRPPTETAPSPPLGRHPLVNAYRCIGCGACVRACPEGGVLGLRSGRAVILDGSRCAGHGLCERVCPVGALQVGYGEVRPHTEVPRLTETFESSVPGLFLVGELAGFALIRHAVEQATVAVSEIAGRLALEGYPAARGAVDVAIVGAGPAGLAAALGAIRAGMSYVLLEQEDLGGAIRHYPRQKLVLTEPVDWPLYGRMEADRYRKDDLLILWHEIVRRHDVRLHRGERLVRIQRGPEGFTLTTSRAVHRARFCVLALGRRGTPRRLGVPGEDLEKVAYRLLDTASYRGRRLLVVGGGNSAVEAAVGLALQPGTRVTLSYRRERFFRPRRRNLERLAEVQATGRLEVLLNSHVREIRPEETVLLVRGDERRLPNDFVFVFAGGTPPAKLLREAGVAFGVDPRAAAPLA